MMSHIEASWSGFLRKNIGVVLQDVFLFQGTVLDNITLRNKEISKEKVIEAARLIDMHDFIIARLPGGYDYNVSGARRNTFYGSTSITCRLSVPCFTILQYSFSMKLLHRVDTERWTAYPACNWYVDQWKNRHCNCTPGFLPFEKPIRSLYWTKEK